MKFDVVERYFRQLMLVCYTTQTNRPTQNKAIGKFFHVPNSKLLFNKKKHNRDIEFESSCPMMKSKSTTKQ